MFYFQVVDFLSGKAPLNLTMRLGDHMMLIQLQLSTVNSSSNAAKRSRTAHGSHSAHSISRTQVSSNTATADRSADATAAPNVTPTAPPAGQQAASGDPYKPKLDTRALTEASKNLTKTLRQLSSEVLTTKCEEVRFDFII